MIDSSDRRFIHIELTDISKKIEMPVRQVVTEVDKDVLEQFSQEEITTLKNMLRKIIALDL
jgi:DNA-binding MarR family transcriptional regulator